jgi:hypothetical protein
MEERPKLPHYDPDYCLKVAKWAASICVAFLIIELLVLFVVDPTNGRCPGWIIYAKNGSATSLWILVGFLTAAPTVWICYVCFSLELLFSKNVRRHRLQPSDISYSSLLQQTKT